MAFYVDTSALVKLVVAEEHTDALRAWLRDESSVSVSSDVARTELLRAVRRVDPDRAVAARAVLDTLVLLTVGSATFDMAGRLDPVVLRSLDALHIASALELGDDLTAIVTYDDRMAQSARALGIPVLSPNGPLASDSAWRPRP